ncbi:Armadillo/beta-catenin-like repeat family protein [Tritrichomonas foetus]|uniref:Armadillo/beta-catenin-like repeat family protein n=1 Tax=Tritrichomonas foetus TaxID=1144522 RepID=A0A1J4L6L3_9EUKA|nr:Armadillo/beta-catenin-like repeat family protein [Tritrichomonas foetus]|eukprot:OHT17644.1 Armadillo/beta-catenin-like repeat family protein [Tritrichomonas foetus]
MEEYMIKFEEEVEKLRKVSGVNPDKYPLRWIKWETQFKQPSGSRAPPWRETEGDLGYVIASTHDQGIVVIMCKDDGQCCPIKGYVVQSDGSEELDYEPTGSMKGSLKSVLEDFSEHFKENYEVIDPNEIPSEAELSREILKNDLISLPQPVLILTPPTNDNDNDNNENEIEDDEPIIPYPKTPPNDQEYWTIYRKMCDYVKTATDPTNTILHEIAGNPNLKETIGQRAILAAGALPSILNVLTIKQAQHSSESHQSRQAEDVIQILSMITLSPNIRRHIAKNETVKDLLEILKKEERPLMEGLFMTIANCCLNTAFRELILKNDGVEPLIYQIKKTDLASQVCYVLWKLNRSEHATQMLMKKHLDQELLRYIQLPFEKLTDVQLVLNITRLYYSIAVYDIPTRKMSRELMIFFSQGLISENTELVCWSAKAFTIFEIPEEQQKTFCTNNTNNNSNGCEGPSRLIRTLSHEDENVIIAGLESIAVVSTNVRIRNEIVDGRILDKIQTLWKHENPEIMKGVLRALGVLTLSPRCAQMTIKLNIIPDLIEYLHSTDPEFVIFSAKAIGSCCTEKSNLSKLMDMNGIRILWSLMKSPYSGVQAASTRALVPFLKSENSPTIVRTFVDGLDLLVDLLRSNDPEVQASACMAITEIARDKENLAVMTDLGLVELLSRLLSSKLDSVRKPLADAIGVSADWANNRRRFGEEGAVDPLVSYLRPPSDNTEVHASTAKALKALSEDNENSNKLRHAGVVKYLLKMVHNRDPDLQMAAAVAIRNIRTNCVHSE